jgi:DNA-binding transcriptional regulator YiaG
MPETTIPDCETWRAIPGYEGFYEASDRGRIRSLTRIVAGRCKCRMQRRGQSLRLIRDKRYGYLVVLLSKHGAVRQFFVHRLVLLAFVGPAPEGMRCCHGNGKRDDNRLSNLRYDTAKANTADAIRHGTLARGERAGNAKLTADDVHAIRSAYAMGEYQRPLARRFGVTQITVSRIVRGETWGHLPLITSRILKSPTPEASAAGTCFRRSTPA